MKNENDNLEKNISRLVKLADDSGQPNKNFTDSLINSTINELTQKAGAPARERKSTIMTVKKIFAYAASILVICGVLIALMTQNKNETKRQLNSVAKHESAKTTITAQKLEDEVKILFTNENVTDWQLTDRICREHSIDVLIIKDTDPIWSSLARLKTQRPALYENALRP